MASRISWIHPVRAAQVLFGIAIFALIIYVMSIYKYDSVSELMLFNGIWTGFFAAPYLTIAPLKFPRFAHYVVEPLVEISAFILWLVGVILLGIALPSSDQCKVAGCEATLATVVLAALECAFFFATSINAIVNAVRVHRKVAEKKQQKAAAQETAPETSQPTETV